MAADLVKFPCRVHIYRVSRAGYRRHQFRATPKQLSCALVSVERKQTPHLFGKPDGRSVLAVEFGDCDRALAASDLAPRFGWDERLVAESNHDFAVAEHGGVVDSDVQRAGLAIGPVVVVHDARFGWYEISDRRGAFDHEDFGEPGRDGVLARPPDEGLLLQLGGELVVVTDEAASGACSQDDGEGRLGRRRSATR